jgi:WD40 repeat protein
VRTGDVTVAVEGLRAAVVSTAPGPRGAVALWNLATGALEHDLPLPGVLRHATLDASGTRVLAATDRTVVLFDAASGEQAARVATQTQFVLPPVFSADGAYLAIAERVDGAAPLFSVLRAADGSLVASFEGPSDVARWELGPGARYVALLGPGNVVRILATRGGLELRRLVLEADVARLAHLASGVLVTLDAEGLVAAWRLAEPDGPPLVLGRAAALSSLDIAAAAERVAYTRRDGAVAVVDARTGVEVARLLEPRSEPPTVPQLAADGTALVTQAGTRLRRWSLPAAAATSAEVAAGQVSAVALDRAGRLVAVGLASGQAEFREDAGRAPSLAYFAHRGAVTSAAAHAERRVAVTGGADGTVRVWDTSTGEPSGVVVPAASDAVEIVALSADGRVVASAAGALVKVAGTADGVVAKELAASADVTALALGADSIAFGDRSGSLVLAPSSGDRAQRSVQLAAAVRALAFASDKPRLAAGSDDGRVTMLDTSDGSKLAELTLPAPVQWVGFTPDGGELLVATDAWVHVYAAVPPFAPVESRLVRLPARHAVLAAVGGTSLAAAGVDASGALARAELDLEVAAAAPLSARELVRRDWSPVLGLRLDDSGLPVSLAR